jgi:hypothetical protein
LKGIDHRSDRHIKKSDLFRDLHTGFGIQPVASYIPSGRIA